MVAPAVLPVRATFRFVSIQIGDTLGDYQVAGALGRGGMGKVFRVRSLLTEREEAMHSRHILQVGVFRSPANSQACPL